MLTWWRYGGSTCRAVPWHVIAALRRGVECAIHGMSSPCRQRAVVSGRDASAICHQIRTYLRSFLPYVVPARTARLSISGLVLPFKLIVAKNNTELRQKTSAAPLGRLNTDTSPQNFRTTFLDNDLTEKFKKSAVANAIAIPLPLCAFLVSFRYAGSEKTWPYHFVSISLALMTFPAVLRQ